MSSDLAMRVTCRTPDSRRLQVDTTRNQPGLRPSTFVLEEEKTVLSQERFEKVIAGADHGAAVVERVQRSVTTAYISTCRSCFAASFRLDSLDLDEGYEGPRRSVRRPSL